jgi:Endonuclease/Exonuclease/phosphatase family
MHVNLKALVAWLATPLVAIGCAADGVGDESQEPETSATVAALTATIPTSANCNQGVGPSKCVQAPPFEVPALTPWTIDGVRGAKEYAGAVTLPFMTDAVFPAGTTGGGAKLQANGTVYLQRVTWKTTAVSLIPKQWLYAFFEDVYVFSVDGVNPLGTLNVYVDNARFDSPDANVHAEDRRYQINLATGTTVTTQAPSGVGSATTWSNVATIIGTQYAAGGCVVTSTPRVFKCKGEMRIPLSGTAVTAPAAGLAPGIGFMARTASLVGMSPDLPVTAYASSDFNIKSWQTVLFTRPRGFDLAITTWNVRRFEPLFQSAAFGLVKNKDIGTFLAKNDIVGIQEGWDRKHVKEIFDEANVVRVAAGLPKYNLYGPIDHQPAMSEVTETIVDGFTDTQGGLWVMSHLPLASQGYHVYTSDSCRGEDCWKAKGVQWVRLMLQDPGDFDPKACREQTAGCQKLPSGDDYIDVFNTHLQANDPLLCKGESDWADIKAAALILLASFVDPVLAYHAALLIELVEADLNCGSLTDRAARAKQLAQMNTFISAVAAKDRSSLILGDFNIDGKKIAGSEYKSALVALKIAPSGAPDDDTVSALPPGGFDVRHGDIVRERTDVDFSTGVCIGTFIDESGGSQEPSCTFAGGTDADQRLDYILVRPPQLVANWSGYPRWFISAVPGSQIWTSPFPSLSGAFSATPLRLSDHKPITAALSFARLSNPPKYNAGWKHTVEQRVISVDATDVEDCLGCGEVDPWAKLVSTIQPSASISQLNHSTECTGTQNPIFGVHGCMSNWVRNRNHTPPNETTVSLKAQVWDDDNTSGDDLIGEGTTSTWNYNSAVFEMSFQLFGNTFPLDSWPNFEAVPMSRCGGIVEVCHSIAITEIAP